MNQSCSFLLLFIFCVVIFGLPIILLMIRLIEIIAEWRASIREAEEKKTGEKIEPVDDWKGNGAMANARFSGPF